MAAASVSGQQASSADTAKPAAPAPQAAATPAPDSTAPKKPVRPKEDWSALPLERSGLDSTRIGAAQIAKWDKGDFTEELLRLEWRHGDVIDLYVLRPKGVEKPPAILYLYDYLNDYDRFRDDGWGKRVTKGGFAAVGFISAVSMDRIHMPRPLKEWFVSELQESLGSSAHDVQMILNYLDKRGDIDMSRIGMFGQGSGASVAVLAAAADPRIKTLDLFNAWGDWPDWLKESPIVPDNERPNYLKPEFLAKVANLDPAHYLPELKSRNVRIEYILDDDTNPKSARDTMLAAAPKNFDIARYKTIAEHARFYRANGLSGWIKSQLQPGTSPTAAQTSSSSPAAGIASNQP